MNHKGLMLGAAALVSLAASSAWATIVPVTLTGTSENINDQTGVFGTAGARLTNLPFTETFMIDTSVGTFAPPTPTSASYNSIFGAPGPYAVSASLTINGHTISIAGDNYSSAFITPGTGATPTVYQLLSDGLFPGVSPSLSNLNFSLELDGANLPVTLTQAASFSGTGSTSPLPYVMQSASGPVTVYDGFIYGLTDSSNNTLINAQGNLFPNSIVIGAVSAAPEPSTWVLMLAAIGGIGAMLRRAKTWPQRAAVVAA